MLRQLRNFGWFALLLCMIERGWGEETLQKGQMVIPKQDVELKLSGKVVGKAKAGEYLQVQEVRGAWVNVGKGKPAWVRGDQLIIGEQALSLLDQQISDSPTNAAAYYARARYYLAHDDFVNAESDLEEVARLDPKNADVYFLRGMIALKANDRGRALEQFTQAINKKGDRPEFYRERAKLHRQSQRISDCIADLEKLVDLNGADAQEYNSLAWWYATSSNAPQRNGKRAVKYATEACDKTGYTNFALLDTLAAAYAETNDYMNAIRWQEEAIKHCDDFSQRRGCQDRLQLYKLNKPYREDPQ